MWFFQNRHHKLFCGSLPRGLPPYAFEVSYEEYVDKVLFFEQLSASLGVPVMDEEMKEIYFGHR